VQEYPLDHQFISAHKRWLAQFRADISSFEGGRGRGNWFDTNREWASWEEDFRSVTELLEGKSERLFQEVSDWREAVGAWGVLVDVGLRRDDLPRVVERVLNELPIDSTILEDSIQSSLCTGDIIKALMDSHELDRWLAAHMGDVFDKLAIIPDDEDRFDTSLRDYYLLDYADMLLDSPSQAELWRVICEYLAAAGDEGRNRLREYVLRVGIRGDELEKFTQLREMCVEFKLDDEWRTISKTIAEMLIRRGELGVAASICLASEDGYLLSRIAEKILAAFVDSGDDEFLRLVNSLPESMLHEAPQKFSELHLVDQVSQTTMVMFASRLAFLSEFRDYLLYLAQGSRDLAAKKLINLLTSGITPVEFWSVLLAESVDLLEGKFICMHQLLTLQTRKSTSTLASHSSSCACWKKYCRTPNLRLATTSSSCSDTSRARTRPSAPSPTPSASSRSSVWRLRATCRGLGCKK
jgi:nuclear pore complex protein Nup85